MDILLEQIDGGIWSPVFTLPRNEKKLFESLRGQGIPAYLPLKRHVNVQPVISKGKSYSYRRILHVPMFPNYLFVNVTPEVRTELNWNRSVVNVFRMDEVQEETLIRELKMIRELEAFSEKEEIDVSNGLRTGNKVLFTGGSFAGWSGIVDSLEPDGMVYINVTSISASVRIKYPAAWCQLCREG